MRLYHTERGGGAGGRDGGGGGGRGLYAGMFKKHTSSKQRAEKQLM